MFLVVCATILVLIWQGFATYRARASVARENAYRKLAEETVAAQRKPPQRSPTSVHGSWP